ncbi:MAG: UTP--glucose-1-phosphate uridylyltransferase GalU [Alcanivoracaceae bacterium]|nr:UTP--glucose-1-phosphate uridylyltransferase GalU [Alcanivoracaceae bacterium]
MGRVKKAVFPVAGLGTRFLPATKASPKEMMPIVDKPLIQYAVEEAVAAGIKEIIFVTSGAKRAIENHFDSNYELIDRLTKKNKHDLVAVVENILPKDVQCVYIRQKEALGLGHAILRARCLIQDEPFAVLLADDLIKPKSQACLKTMVEMHEKTGASVVAVERVAHDKVDRYGIVVTDNDRIKAIVEKPTIDQAPSNLGVIGRYILDASIFDYLEKTTPGSQGEIQLTDAISAMLEKHIVMAHEIDGRRYDCGDKFGYLKAVFDFALMHPEFGEQCKQYLKKRLKS